MRFLKALAVAALLCAGAAVTSAQQTQEEATHVLLSVPVSDSSHPLVEALGTRYHDPATQMIPIHTMAPVTTIVHAAADADADDNEDSDAQPFTVLMLQPSDSASLFPMQMDADSESAVDSESELAAYSDADADAEILTDSDDDTVELMDDIDSTMEIAARSSDYPELSRLSRLSRRFSVPLRQRFRSLPRRLMSERAVRQESAIKQLLQMKKIKALDLKMKLMNRVLAMLQVHQQRAVRGFGGGYGMGLGFGADAPLGAVALKLMALSHKLDKKLTMMKVMHLVHLLHDCVHHGRALSVGDASVSPYWLQQHILAQIMRRRSFIPAFLRMKIVQEDEQKYAPMIWMLKLKVLKALHGRAQMFGGALAGAAAAAGSNPMMKNFLVKADRAIVNLGNGNEFKPLFYRSRASPTVSLNGARISVPVSGAAVGEAIEHMRERERD